MLSLREIQYVASVAEEGSYSRAAEKLFVSQPALSQAVSRLEMRLGLQLLMRDGNKMVLTSTGQWFVEHGIGILQATQQLENHLYYLQSVKGECIRIGISQFYSLHHLARFLPTFERYYSNVEVQLFEAESAELELMVLNGEVDLAMVPMPLNSMLEYEVLHQEEIFFAVPGDNPLAASAPRGQDTPYIDLSLARDEKFIFLRKMRFTGQAFELCSEAGFRPNIIYETKNWDTAHAFVQNGLGVTFIPEILVHPSRQLGAPVYFRIKSEHAYRPYVVVYRKREELSNIMLRFIEVAKSIFADPSIASFSNTNNKLGL